MNEWILIDNCGTFDVYKTSENILDNVKILGLELEPWEVGQICGGN